MIGEPLLDRLLEGSRAHAARRVDEMEAARDLLLELGVEPRVADGERCAARRARGRRRSRDGDAVR